MSNPRTAIYVSALLGIYFVGGFFLGWRYGLGVLAGTFAPPLYEWWRDA
jgi:hypothetical protein